MNIAEKLIDGYDTNDFKSAYIACLHERFVDNEAYVVKRIEELFNRSTYETERYFEHSKSITPEQAKRIFDYISENIENFVKPFKGCYVGHMSLDSVTFAEREEQLSGLYNSKTGKPYDVKYLRKVFNDAGYYVRKDYAYYNVGGGLHVGLINCKDEINAIIND